MILICLPGRSEKSKEEHNLCAAVAATTKIAAHGKAKLEFSLSWDNPVVHFGSSKKKHYRCVIINWRNLGEIKHKLSCICYQDRSNNNQIKCDWDGKISDTLHLWHLNVWTDTWFCIWGCRKSQHYLFCQERHRILSNNINITKLACQNITTLLLICFFNDWGRKIFHIFSANTVNFSMKRKKKS